MFITESTRANKQNVEITAMHETTQRLFLAAKEIAGATSLTEVAKLLKQTTQTVKNWESRGMSQAGINTACSVLEVAPKWLATGEGEMRGITAAGSMALPAIIGSGVASNVVPIASSVKVPLVSWVQAGAPSEIREPDPYTEWTKKSWVQAWHSAPGRFAFALRVEGDSMTSPYPNQLSFPEGTLLIVDPDRAALAGDFVIAKDIATQQATFKKLMQDGGRWYLRALNPAYQAIEIDDPAVRIIARVIEYQLPGGKL